MSERTSIILGGTGTGTGTERGSQLAREGGGLRSTPCRRSSSWFVVCGTCTSFGKWQNLSKREHSIVYESSDERWKVEGGGAPRELVEKLLHDARVLLRPFEAREQLQERCHPTHFAVRQARVGRQQNLITQQLTRVFNNH